MHDKYADKYNVAPYDGPRVRMGFPPIVGRRGLWQGIKNYYSLQPTLASRTLDKWFPSLAQRRAPNFIENPITNKIIQQGTVPYTPANVRAIGMGIPTVSAIAYAPTAGRKLEEKIQKRVDYVDSLNLGIGRYLLGPEE